MTQAAAHPQVSVVIVAYRSREFLPQCVAGLAAQTFGDFEAIVIVNGSEDDSVDGLELPDPRFRIERLEHNVGFAAGNNYAAKLATGTWLAALNPDAVPQPGWLAELMAATRRWPRAASFGSTQLSLEDPTTLDGVGDVWHAAGMPWRARVGWPAAMIPPEGEAFAACAAAALYRRDVFLALDGFDERYFCYCEDIDLAFRMRLAGHAIVQVPSAVVHHAGSGITGRYSEFSQFHGNRNRIWTYYKNTPAPWHIVLLPMHIAYDIAMLASGYRRGVGGAVMRSYVAAVRGLGVFRASRRQVQSSRRVSTRDLFACMAWGPLTPKRRDAPRGLLAVANRAARARTDASTGPRGDLVTILMCTFNGARFVGEQLASLEQQTYRNWRLIVSDDGSTDGTLEILKGFAARVPQSVEIRRGPGHGAIANFVSLAADTSISGDHFAFCDQDDIWHPGKLARALAWLTDIDATVPAAYGGRTRLIDEHGLPTGHSHAFGRPPSFANALIQSIAGANTMLLNRAAKRLWENAGPVDVVSHDWWTYQLVTGSGGVFRYDEEPQLDYRQHAANVMGGNRGFAARMKRLRMAVQGGFAAWNDRNILALERSRQLLTEDSRRLLDAYKRMREGALATRLHAFASTDIRRQSFVGNVGLLAAVVLKRL